MLQQNIVKSTDIYPVKKCILVHDFICLHAIYSWYLVSVELTIRNDNSILQTWRRTPLKSIRIALVMFFWVIFASWHWQMLAFLLLVLNFYNYLINKINFLQIRKNICYDTQEYIQICICTKSVLRVAAEICIFYKPPLPLNIYIYVLKWDKCH